MAELEGQMTIEDFILSLDSVDAMRAQGMDDETFWAWAKDKGINK